MRPRSRKVTVAAALLAVAALTGCGAGPKPSETAAVATPSPEAAPPAVVAPPPAQEQRQPAPLSPPREQPMPAVPTVRGPYVPPQPAPAPAPSPSHEPAPTQSAPGGMPTPTPTATPTPTPSATPVPARLATLLPRASDLPPLTWSTAEGDRTATWTEVAAPAAVPVASALTHVSAARGADDGCASASQRVDANVLAAAAVSLAAEPAPGAPMDVVLLRYPTAAMAADALAALRGLGTACAGVETEDGVLGAGAGGRVTLTADDAVLVVEAAARGPLLIAVQHEGAPPEAVAALRAAGR